MLTAEAVGLVCPYCGLLFFTQVQGVFYCCPECSRRWKASSNEMLTATLGEITR